MLEISNVANCFFFLVFFFYYNNYKSLIYLFFFFFFSNWSEECAGVRFDPWLA